MAAPLPAPRLQGRDLAVIQERYPRSWRTTSCDEQAARSRVRSAGWSSSQLSPSSAGRDDSLRVVRGWFDQLASASLRWKTAQRPAFFLLNVLKAAIAGKCLARGARLAAFPVCRPIGPTCRGKRPQSSADSPRRATLRGQALGTESRGWGRVLRRPAAAATGGLVLPSRRRSCSSDWTRRLSSAICER